MRLDKLLANMGVGSRKEVKEMIRKGRVTVNDRTIRQSKHRVNAEKDHVTVDDQPITYQEFIYLMLHKPAGYISATVDAVERTVIDLLPADLQHFKPFPVGRLDKDTEGLLLITNDGEMGHHLTSPDKEVEKTYYAEVSGEMTEETVKAFEGGVTLRDGHKTKPASLNVLKSGDKSEIELTLTEGRYHQVKRMVASQGGHVDYLKRIRMGTLTLDPSLEKGEYRELTEEECEQLKQLMNE